MTDVILKDPVLDGGIEVLNTTADAIWVCAGTPVSYIDAQSKELGEKSFSAGAVFGSPTNATPNGRQVTSVPVTDGLVNVSGTVSCWAVVDTVGETLLAVGNLTGGMAVTAGWAWTLDAFTIKVPAAAAAAATFDIVYQNVVNIGPFTSPGTASAVPLGTAAAGRVIVLVGNTYFQDEIGISGITIGGVTAVKQIGITNVPDAANFMEIWSAVVPTGTTGDVVITGPTGSVNYFQFTVFSIYAAASATAYDTGSALMVNPLEDSSFTGPAGGGGIGIVKIVNAVPTLDWGDGVEVYSVETTDKTAYGTQLFVAAASGPAMSVSWPTAGAGFYSVFASWGP